MTTCRQPEGSGAHQEEPARQGVALAAPVIELAGVRFSYGATPVLRGIDLTLREGELCALVGANGAGKSTIVKIVLGELAPLTGRSLLFGSVSGLASGARHRAGLVEVGYVPQRTPAAYDHFPATVGEVVGASVMRRVSDVVGHASPRDDVRTGGLGRRARRLSGRQVREAVTHVLRLTGVEDLAGRMIGRLSGGQLQRVMLARALVNNPRLLLLDEPTTGLDEQSIQAFYRTVERERSERGVAVLLVTHDLANAPRLGGRVLELRDGTLRPYAPTAEGRDVPCSR